MDLQNEKIFNYKKMNKKNLLISVVALIEVILLLIVSTYSWIEKTSSLQILGEGDIDTSTYYLANVSTATNSDKVISLDKYFRASGNVHFVPALSPDGENFYFKKLNYTNGNFPYRKGNINDKNVNYISFSFKAKSDSYTAFYFDSELLPKIKIGDQLIEDNDVRFAITADGNTAIYSNKQVSDEKFTINGTEYSSVVRSFEDYTDTEAVFELESGATETITITMWLNDTANADYTGKEVTVSNFKLISTAQKTTQIKFVDKTTAFNGETSEGSKEDNGGYGWITTDQANMWVSYGNTVAKMKQTTDSEGFTVWTYNAKGIESASNIYFYRSSPNVTQSPQTASNHWNVWSTTWAKATEANSVTYTAYSTADKKNGYGTWKDVVQYTLSSENGSVLSYPNTGETYNATHVTLEVDGVTSTMNYNVDKWKAFLPVSDKDKPTVKFTIVDNTITATAKPKSDYNYTITSSTTGYWGTPVVISVDYATDSDNTKGTISVSGGVPNAKTVKVTKGDSVTLSAAGINGYQFDGWYDKLSGGNKLSDNPSYELTNVASDKNIYAAFKIAKSNYKLMGYGGDWNTGWEMFYLDQNKVYVEKQLPAGNFEFKIKEGGNWYGCDTSIYNETASDIYLTTDTKNIKFYSYGGTYKFIFDLNSHKLQVVDDKNTTIVLALDATSNTWVADLSPVVWLEDVGNNNLGYKMTKISDYVWMVDVPTTVVNINFKRNNQNNTETWNYWNNTNRNNCRGFVVTGNGNNNGVWK